MNKILEEKECYISMMELLESSCPSYFNLYSNFLNAQVIDFYIVKIYRLNF